MTSRERWIYWLFLLGYFVSWAVFDFYTREVAYQVEHRAPMSRWSTHTR